ncbi:MAG: DNA polymerase III subunit gamma/tau, partial [Firmicutes bacterium]|nr:DNA polymerase III subunit gamma/tau [Bacillota bacterium]
CRAIAAGSFMDVIEIDAASNNGVDNIRELRESVKYPPQVGSKKVYIIDEVHMLSTGAFNALLKTLEEPPENVIFILCTTEPQKLPQTILSRCMRLDFKRVPQAVLEEDMRNICSERGVSIDDDALKLLAVNADGSVRDGLSILDQVLASGDEHITREEVLDYLGTVGDEFFIELTDLVSLHKSGEALMLLDKVLREGRDAKQLMKDWNSHYRNLLITKFMRDPDALLNMSSENVEKVKEQSMHIGFDEIEKAILRISKTINEARWSTQPRILMELDIVALSGGKGSYMTEAVPREVKAEVQKTSPVRDIPKEESVPVTEDTVNEPEEQTIPASAPKPDILIKTIDMDKPIELSREQLERNAARSTADFDSEVLDLEDLWRDAMEEGEATSGSFNLIRSWTRLKDVRKGTYTIAVSTEFARKHVQEKIGTIDSIMSDILKRPVRGGIVLEKHSEKKKTEPEKDYVREAKDALGLDIIVED